MHFTPREEQRGMHTQQGSGAWASLSSGHFCHKTQGYPQHFHPQLSPHGSDPCPALPPHLPGSRAPTAGTEQQQLPLFPVRILPPRAVTSSSEAKPNYWQTEIQRNPPNCHRLWSAVIAPSRCLNLSGPLMSQPLLTHRLAFAAQNVWNSLGG